MKVVDSLAMRAAFWAISVLSIITTALIWIDLFLKPGGIPISYGVLNRTLGRLVLRGVSLRSIHDKPVQEGFISAEAI